MRVEWVVERVNGEDGREWVLCVWIMERMVGGIVWKGYEVKGVDGGGGYQNELRTVETNSRWKGELKNESSSSDEKTESHYIFYKSIQSENEYVRVSLC